MIVFPRNRIFMGQLSLQGTESRKLTFHRAKSSF